MEFSSTLLKQEINDTQAAQHDLAKWKLLVTASLGAAAFGLVEKGDPERFRWLLLFIPFVCAYVDLYDYQYRLRVFVIARFLREMGSDPELKKYEQECQRVRESCADDIFDVGRWAGLGSSLVASIVGPLIYFLLNPGRLALLMVAAAIWFFGLFLIFFFYWDFRQKERKLTADSTAVASRFPHLPHPKGA
jgi:hypothetical protein